VVGEPQRAFYGNQFGNTFPIFAHYGVPLWVPEVGGPIDPENEAHDLIMSVFGGVSKGERNRIKIRVRTAMAAQAQLEGRFLGGRPPFGYKLIDVGRIRTRLRLTYQPAHLTVRTEVNVVRAGQHWSFERVRGGTHACDYW
jgi:DNA invertase Pin-like site-specific DNA recombinase